MRREIGGDHFRSECVFPQGSRTRSRRRVQTCSSARRSTDRRTEDRQDTPIPSMQLCIENLDQEWRLLRTTTPADNRHPSVGHMRPPQPLPIDS
jgi:hypothetical protein